MSELNALVRLAYDHPEDRAKILPRILSEMRRQAASLGSNVDSSVSSAEESADSQFSMEVKHLPRGWSASVKVGNTRFSVKGAKFDDLLDELVARLEDV